MKVRGRRTKPVLLGLGLLQGILWGEIDILPSAYRTVVDSSLCLRPLIHSFFSIVGHCVWRDGLVLVYNANRCSFLPNWYPFIVSLQWSLSGINILVLENPRLAVLRLNLEAVFFGRPPLPRYWPWILGDKDLALSVDKTLIALFLSKGMWLLLWSLFGPEIVRVVRKVWEDCAYIIS